MCFGTIYTDVLEKYDMISGTSGRCGNLSHNKYCVQARISCGSVYIDEDKQQEVEHDADDSEHSQESLLWCASVWTR